MKEESLTEMLDEFERWTQTLTAREALVAQLAVEWLKLLRAQNEVEELRSEPRENNPEGGRMKCAHGHELQPIHDDAKKRGPVLGCLCSTLAFEASERIRQQENFEALTADPGAPATKAAETALRDCRAAAEHFLSGRDGFTAEDVFRLLDPAFRGPLRLRLQALDLLRNLSEQ